MIETIAKTQALRIIGIKEAQKTQKREAFKWPLFFAIFGPLCGHSS